MHGRKCAVFNIFKETLHLSCLKVGLHFSSWNLSSAAITSGRSLLHILLSKNTSKTSYLRPQKTERERKIYLFIYLVPIHIKLLLHLTSLYFRPPNHSFVISNDISVSVSRAAVCFEIIIMNISSYQEYFSMSVRINNRWKCMAKLDELKIGHSETAKEYNIFKKHDLIF